MYESIASNKRQSVLLLFVFVILIAGIGYVFGMYSELGEWAILPAVVIALFMSWAGFYHSDKIVLKMSGARPVTHAQEPQLDNVVEGLSLAAGMPKPALYIIEDTAPNAFATGRDPQHAALAVTRGLLQKMDRLQLEGVVAHEMAHIQNFDIRFMTLVSVMVGTIALLSDWMRRSLWYGGRRRRRSRSSGGAQGLIMLIGLLFVILAPIIAQLMQRALSRRREFLADASAAMLTRYPEGLAGALEKLDADTEPLEVANKATAHLYIINPLKEHGGKINRLFSTHPPIEERVAKLRAM